MWSSRSSSAGTQPMPPSERQMRMSGWRTGTSEYSQSTAANIAYPKNSTPITSGGASADVDGEVPDDPMCRLITVWVSAHASMNGSQWPEWSDGSPSSRGISENVTALKP